MPPSASARGGRCAVSRPERPHKDAGPAPGAGPRGPGRCRATRRAGLRDSSQGPGAPPGAKDASSSVWPVLANPGAGAIPTHAPGAAVGRSRVRPKRRDQPSRTRPRRHRQTVNSGPPGAPGGQGSAQAAAHVAETPHSPAPHDPDPRDPRRQRPRAGGRAERPRALTVRYRGRPRGRPVAGPSPQTPPPRRRSPSLAGPWRRGRSPPHGRALPTETGPRRRARQAAKPPRRQCARARAPRRPAHARPSPRPSPRMRPSRPAHVGRLAGTLAGAGWGRRRGGGQEAGPRLPAPGWRPREDDTWSPLTPLRRKHVCPPARAR